MVTPALHISYVCTRHFEFLGLGLSETHAKESLMKGWEAHCRQYPDADPDHITADDLQCIELSIGQCARDGHPLTEPDGRVLDPFTNEERLTIFEAARTGLVYYFESLAEKLDMADAILLPLRDKLQAFMNSEAPSYGGTFVVCEVICQRPSVSVFYNEEAAMEHAVQCAVENLTSPDWGKEDIDDARLNFKLTLGEHERISEGDYEVYILTPNK